MIEPWLCGACGEVNGPHRATCMECGHDPAWDGRKAPLVLEDWDKMGGTNEMGVWPGEDDSSP